jgi:hypothetical protein
MIIDTTLLEIDSGAINYIADDLRIDISYLRVRHLDGWVGLVCRVV